MKIFKMSAFAFAGVVLAPVIVNAQLSVTITPPKVMGQKAIVPLVMKNGFREEINRVPFS